MSSLLYKNINSTPIHVTSGGGVWLQDAAGKQYLDACGGVAVSSLGHCHPRVAQALQLQSSRLSWAHAGSFTTTPAEELAQWLVAKSNGMVKAQFLSGGSEAIELSLKVAYQYQCEVGESGRTTFIARRQSYHGSTFGALGISGNAQRRSIFEPFMMPTAFVSPCYEYREREEAESVADYVERLGQELESRILAIGARKVAGFIVEPVVGSTNGAVPAAPGYLVKVQEVCKKYGVVLILDEVMAGMGRTGFDFAYLEDGITPDIVVVGKGLAAGYQPISAVLIGRHICDALARGTGVLQNGQTHVNHPLACAIALEVQKTIHEDDLLRNVNARGTQMRALLRQGLDKFDCFGDVRGRGLFLGVEFVDDQRTKAPFSGGDRFAAKLKTKALERGLLIYPGSGTADGARGNHVLFAPAFIASPSEIEEMVERFFGAVRACF